MSPSHGMNGDTANSRDDENAGSVDPHHSNHDPFKIPPKGPTERLKEWRAVGRFERAGRSADQDEAPADSGVGPKTVVNFLQDRKVTDLDKLGNPDGVLIEADESIMTGESEPVTGYLGQLYAIPKPSPAQLLAFVFMTHLVKGSGDQTQADSSSGSAVDKNSWTDPQIAGVVVALLALVIGSIVPCCLFWWKERREDRRNFDIEAGLSNAITGTDGRPLRTHARECQTQVLPAIADNTVTSDTITSSTNLAV